MSRTPRHADAQPAVARVAKRCATCARIRAYEPDDRFCLACGHEDLAEGCGCGRSYDYALGEASLDLHCPRCGTSLTGKVEGFEA